ncbi:MAG: NAD(P)/FAD-dependent oxidoreductase, partial [Bacteroidales bacterium]|nr:NAD(P)/FAD-dependent oxidoreductase [Bacteroidales bacterium]
MADRLLEPGLQIYDIFCNFARFNTFFLKSDIIVIGGGAAGLVAAVGAAQELSNSGKMGTVTVLEKMPKAGRKVMITGKGRCNFTNVKPWQDFSAHVKTDPQFVSPAWHNL